MQNFKIKLKRNKYIIFCVFIILCIIGFSFYQYYKDYFSYSKVYYKIKEECPKIENKNTELCQYFQKNSLEDYIRYEDPIQKYKKLDTITLASEVMEHNIFWTLSYFSPLLIILCVVGRVQPEFSSGFFKNKLLRISYKEYIKNIHKFIVKISLIMPFAYILVVLISCLVTQFNFNVLEETKQIAVYTTFKYDHYLLYSFIICILQFMMSIIYSHIALICLKKNKNIFVTVLIAYLLTLALTIFIYAGVYAYLINKVFGFKELTDYFNILGYWYFRSKPNFFLLFLIPFLTLCASFITFKITYLKKEQVIVENEKKVA